MEHATKSVVMRRNLYSSFLRPLWRMFVVKMCSLLICATPQIFVEFIFSIIKLNISQNDYLNNKI